MKQWYNGMLWLWVLFLIGCGATTHQSEPADKPQTSRRGNQYLEQRWITEQGNPYFVQGNKHLKRKEFHKAIEQYRLALHSEPDSAIIHAALGWAYYSVGMFDAALAEAEVVNRLEPGNPDVQKILELLHQQRNRRR